MNTKHGILLLGIGLLLFCVFVGTASAKTWYVDDDGGPGIDFTNIQDAIDAANKSDTIYVYNGTYYERISISKSLTLSGENRSANIIGIGSGKCVYITASNVTIEGFTVKNGDYAIYTENVNKCFIVDNMLKSLLDIVISSNVSIINNSLEDAAIYIRESKNISIISNLFFEGNRAIYIQRSLNNVIRNNVIKNNSHSIHLVNSNYNRISKNVLDSTEIIAIELECSCHNLVSDNVLTNIKDSAISLWEGSDNNSIYHNTISGTGYSYTGFSLSGCYNSLISNNISGSNYIGFQSGSNYNTIRNNTFITTGLWIRDIYFNQIYQNNFLIEDYYAYMSDESINSWDNGPIDGGNYWSIHECIGNPNNGSQPFYLNEKNVDHYPYQDRDGWLLPLEKPIFDTCEPSNPYPSISGTHTGTLTTNQTVTVSKLYTYPCSGTGGHTEYIKIWNNSDWNVTARWDGYEEDWHNISFDNSFILKEGETYNYTIHTGSYPQIHHTSALPTANGWINCTKFTDANGKVYTDWIPAIRLW